MAFEKKSFNNIYENMVAETRHRIPQLTDFEEGSVIRSLYETFAYELALLYEQMDLVYQAGFIDTATGAALDRVVAVLGIKRNEPDFATGEVTFQRDPGSKETIIIPLGTLVTTDKNAYLTTEEGKLPEKVNSVSVKIQAEERGKEMSTQAETITIMPRPVSGIKSVHNPNPIRFLGRDRETDEELRQRAKNALLGSGRASITSIENALLGMSGVHGVHIRENMPKYGVIEVYVDTPNFQKNRQLLQARIDKVRAAGIYAILKPADKIEINAVLQIDIDIIDDQERQHIENQGRKIVTQFINQLQMGQPLLFSQLTREILQLKGINDLRDFKITTSRHKTYTPQHKRIDATFSQRLVPARIIVASEIKELAIYIQIQVIFPDKTARDGIKIAKQIPTLINQINLNAQDFLAPNEQWAIAFNDEINHQIQNFFEQLTTASQKLKTELAASLDQPIQAIFVKAVKEYFNSAGTKKITELQQQLKNTLAQKPPEQLREALKQTLEHKLTAFLDEQMLHFPEMKEIFEQGITETYRKKSNHNQQWRDEEISKRNQAYQDELEIERWKLNHKKQTDSYNTKLEQMRAALEQDKKQVTQTFESHQQQIETNREEGLKSLKSLTDKLKETSKTLVSQKILNPDALTNIVKETGQLSAYDFRLTMIEGAFQNEIKILREVSDIQPSFVENAVLDMIFVYSDRLELKGQLKLTLSLTTTEDEKERLKNTVTQSIKDYLTLLKPKEPVDLKKIRNIAAAQENVLQINFKPEDCHLMFGETILTDRNKEQNLRIESFEKVFLSEDFVSLQ